MQSLGSSFRFALKGIVHAFLKERNMKIHAGVMVLVVVAGFVFGLAPGEWLPLLLTIALVVSLEMINTAIESLVDLVTEEYRLLAYTAKNVAAGAVLFAALLATVIGLIIFLPHIISFF
ncbi:MAG: diacylglycerol kinase family protein [Clostridiales bacterium]|jgi:diacylglycerol kinase|nr:diacylglycerol kinase family protein [Clostridiales bacterium]